VKRCLAIPATGESFAIATVRDAIHVIAMAFERRQHIAIAGIIDQNTIATGHEDLRAIGSKRQIVHAIAQLVLGLSLFLPNNFGLHRHANPNLQSKTLSKCVQDRRAAANKFYGITCCRFRTLLDCERSAAQRRHWHAARVETKLPIATGLKPGPPALPIDLMSKVKKQETRRVEIINKVTQRAGCPGRAGATGKVASSPSLSIAAVDRNPAMGVHRQRC
jgi:hypothetical protein